MKHQSSSRKGAQLTIHRSVAVQALAFLDDPEAQQIVLETEELKAFAMEALSIWQERNKK